MLVVRGQRVVLGGTERPASIHIDHGVILDVRDFDDTAGASEVVEADRHVVMPGLVDSHVHVNEPGRTEWEGFDTATRAAAAGGVTTIIDMPLNSIPSTVDVAALEAKREAARGRCHVDVGFWGGIVPGNEASIEALIESGVRGFKCFMTPSGVDEFASVGVSDLRRTLPYLAHSAGCRLLVHAEDPSLLNDAQGDPHSYSTFLETRPVEAEVSAVSTIADLAGEYDVAAHIVHVSSVEGMDRVAAAQSAGVKLTAETCPHYLTFTATDIRRGATVFKCAPPIRAPRHREELWRALRRGTCAMVVSDHSPAPAAMKQTGSGDFMMAWGGIASLELSLRTVWTGAARRGFDLRDVVSWMSEQPARLCGLADRKGSIQPGYDADLVLFDPDSIGVVDADNLQQRHKLTPYDGYELRGAVRTTFVRGEKIWDQGTLVRSGRGSLL